MPEHPTITTVRPKLYDVAAQRQHAHIIGQGFALPVSRVEQADALAFAVPRNAETQAHARWIGERYEHCGVECRYSVFSHCDAVDDDPDSPHPHLSRFFPLRDDLRDRGPTTAARMDLYRRCAPALAGDALRMALAESSSAADAVDHLVVVSCTGFMAPGLEIELIERLAMRCDVQRTNIGFMGCHGAINGLRTASALALAQPDATIALVCVELCSLHFQYGFRPDQVVANALFGDAAAATIVRAQFPESAQMTHRQPDHPRQPVAIVDSTSLVLPGSQGEMGWIIGDHGFEMQLARTVPASIDAALGPFLATWLAGHGLTRGDIAGWAVHPGGPRILDSVGRCVPPAHRRLDASRTVLREIGNVSSGTVLWVLQELLDQQVRGYIVLLAFGPGLSIEAALLYV